MYDYHIHSTQSGDSLAPDRVQVLAASHFGMREVCFTNHYDLDFPYNNNFEMDIADFMNDMAELQNEFEGLIGIKRGIEVGMQMHILDTLAEDLSGYTFDYILASKHVLDMGDGRDLHRPASWEGRSKYEVLKWYLREIMDCIKEFDDFNCIGHITYCSRYCPTDDREVFYADAPDEFDELFRILAQRGKGIEINTQTYRKLGFLVPDYDIVKRFRELGGEIVTTGSDAHMPNFIGANFNEAHHMLKQAGFDYVCSFNERRAVFNKMDWLD